MPTFEQIQKSLRIADEFGLNKVGDEFDPPDVLREIPFIPDPYRVDKGNIIGVQDIARTLGVSPQKNDLK